MYYTSLIILNFSTVLLNDYTEPENTIFLCSAGCTRQTTTQANRDLNSKLLHEIQGYGKRVNNYTDFEETSIHNTTVPTLTAIQAYSGFFGATLLFTQFCSF